jgi:hypothetical protein
MVIWFLFLELLLVSYYYDIEVFAVSPSFPRQEVEPISITDKRNDYNLTAHNYVDIQSVNYLSDGNFLNATIWLDSFENLPSGWSINVSMSQYSVGYGMYIDADFNDKTGIQGIDYRIEKK